MSNPHELPPIISPDLSGPDLDSPLFNEMRDQQVHAEQQAVADQHAAEREEAEALGLPYMSPADRAHLENVANAQHAGELPDTVSAEDRRAATRGFHTSHRAADAHLEGLREDARTQLEEFGNKRTTVEQQLMETERKYAGDQVFANVANGGYDSVDERVKAEMAKHDKVKGESARAMLEANLRDQYIEEARRAADAAADAREAHINSRGGIARLNTIDREDREAAEKAKRDAEELVILEEAHAENDRRKAETREWQERMGIGRTTGPTGAPGEVRPTVDNRTGALERPEGVSFKDWYNADPAGRQRLVDEAADAELMKIADAVREEPGEHPAGGRARVPAAGSEASDDWDVPYESGDEPDPGSRLDEAEEAEPARRRAHTGRTHEEGDDLSGFTRRDELADFTRRETRPEPEQPEPRRRWAVARQVAKLIFHPDSWSGVHDEVGRTRIQNARRIMGKRILEILHIGPAADTGEGRPAVMDDEDAVDAGFENAEDMEAAEEELRRRPEESPVRPTPARVSSRRPSPRRRDPRDEEIRAGLDE